jgi:hypothetical protein
MNSTETKEKKDGAEVSVLKTMLRELILIEAPINIAPEEQEQCKNMIRNYFLEKRSRVG